MNIIIYTSPSDQWSAELKTFLKKKKLQFEEREVMEEHPFWGEVLQKTDQLSTPVIDIDGTIIVGFDKERIEKALS
ncbi:NrdH-redoxin [Candidatus Woesearchaeota archaeon CG10_big_fil_rev_8_21_14_0_10_45_16]|nr:MAG: NrdH-redoxin [Candidatus Woesearchaeota archaeon CG10_big_fil_rev_8_21_14_0_10_45_16]